MRKHRSSSNMMEESDYLEYEEPLFTFDNEQDEAAAMDHMDHMDMHDDIDEEPLTPYGSVEPSAPASKPSASGSGRLHLSSAPAWQNPEHSSPPALSHSPSPRPPATFQYHQQDHRAQPRYVSRRNSAQYQPDQLDRQLPRQSLGQLSHPPSDDNPRHQEAQHSDHANHVYPQSYEVSPQYAPSKSQADLEEPDLITLSPNQDQEYVMIPAEEVEMMFNGNEESRITAQKFKDQVINATLQNGKVVYMVGQATVEWWMSPDMQKRRRAAGRKLLDVSGAVVTGAGSAIMSNTPLGRVCDSVSTNVNAFRAAPFSYTMQGLGIMKKSAGAMTVVSSAGMNGHNSQDDYIASPDNKHPGIEPTIADEDAFVDEWEDDEGMGMGMGMFDEA